MKKLLLLLTALPFLGTTLYGMEIEMQTILIKKNLLEQNPLKLNLLDTAQPKKVYSQFAKQDIDKRYEQLENFDIETCQQQVNSTINDWEEATSYVRKLRNIALGAMAITGISTITIFTLEMRKTIFPEPNANQLGYYEASLYAFLGSAMGSALYAGVYEDICARFRYGKFVDFGRRPDNIKTSNYVFDQLKKDKSGFQKLKEKILKEKAV